MDERLRKALEIAAQRTANDPRLAELRKRAEEMEAAGMSTDGPTPPPCDDDIFEHGTCVFDAPYLPSNAMEGWVQQIAEKSGQRVDWHFMAGRGRVLVQSLP